MAKKNSSSVIWPIAVCLVILGAYLCSKYQYQFLLIQGRSMYPAYHNLQMVILDKRSTEYHRGDVIAAEADVSKTLIVKRIAGCPGDLLEIRNGVLLVNGELDPFYRDTLFAYSGLLEKPLLLGAEEFFLIGDNVEQSIDSRYEEVGILTRERIKGLIR